MRVQHSVKEDYQQKVYKEWDELILHVLRPKLLPLGIDNSLDAFILEKWRFTFFVREILNELLTCHAFN